MRKVSDKRKWYREEYLHSPHWAELRARKLAENPICEICLKARANEPHHVNYRNIFDVELTDLISVCRSCHETEHERLDSEKRRRDELLMAKLARRDMVQASISALGGPPQFPFMLDKHGIPVVTVKALQKRFAPRLAVFLEATGVTREESIGLWIPACLFAEMGIDGPRLQKARW